MFWHRLILRSPPSPKLDQISAVWPARGLSEPAQAHKQMHVKTARLSLIQQWSWLRAPGRWTFRSELRGCLDPSLGLVKLDL